MVSIQHMVIYNLYTVEEYIKHLSKLTDEDLKLWLRDDLQGDISNT